MSCPNCGHCPACGRSDRPPLRPLPYPYWQRPAWYQGFPIKTSPLMPSHTISIQRPPSTTC